VNAPPVRRVALIDAHTTGHHPGYASALIDALAARGIAATVIGPQALLDALTGPARAADRIPLAYRHGRGFSAEWRKRAFLRDALAHARRAEADLAHLLFLDRFVLAAATTVRAAGMPVVATLHQGYFAPGVPSSRAAAPVRGVERRALAGLIRRGMRLQVLHDDVRAAFGHALPAEGTDVVPYPVGQPGADLPDRAAARRDLDLPQDAYVALAFGATRHEKGADIAARGLRHAPDDMVLLVAGREGEVPFDDLRRIAAEAGAEERLVIHAGFVPDDRTATYFAAADVVIAPYRRRFLGMSGPVSIAAEVGRPVVAADLPVLRDQVARYDLGTVFTPESPQAFADALARLRARPARPDAARYRADHGPEALADALVASYRAAASSGHGDEAAR
jgi:glycosyltransferase involved in cell wall biosynthesis